MVQSDARRHRAYGPSGRTLRFIAAWVVGYLYLVGLAIVSVFLKPWRLWGAFKQLLRMVKFAAVGITVAVIGYGLLFMLVDVVGLPKTVSYLIEAAISVELNFLGSRYITWRDRLKHSGFWRSWSIFHGARVVTFGINQGLFSLQLLVFSTWPVLFAFNHNGFDYGYLVANTACIIVSASFNYAANDEYTFAGRKTSNLANAETAVIELDTVSVIIPCKNSPVGDTVRAVLNQDYTQLYPGRVEIILVGSPGDTSWADVDPKAIRSGRVKVIELPVPVTPGRDANAKRAAGLARSGGRIKWFLDSDVIPPPSCLSLIIDRIVYKGFPVVAGPVPSVKSEWRRFWPLFIDSAGGKTPRWVVPYVLTLRNLGQFKFPVTANLAFVEGVKNGAGGPAVEFTNSYEDYEWVLRMLQADYPVLCDPALQAPRRHRVGFKRLRREHIRSGRGCADFIVRHRSNLFTVWRLLMMNAVPIGIAAAVAAAIYFPALALVFGVAFILSRMLGCWLKAGRLWDPRPFVFPFIGWYFTLCFVYGNCLRFFTRGLSDPVRPRIGVPVQMGYPDDERYYHREDVQ